jgi:hypothetical protein
VAARGASLGHRDLTTHPGAGVVDRLARPEVLGPSRLEEVEDVLCARCRPQSEEMVIRISEGPTAADRHEARVPDLREDHDGHSSCVHPPETLRRARAVRHAPEQGLHTRRAPPWYRRGRFTADPSPVPHERYLMRSTILWPLAAGALVALILVVAAVSLSASGFRLDVERWVLIGAFLVVIAMAAAAVVSALNALKDVREQSTRDEAGNDSGDDRSSDRS